MMKNRMLKKLEIIGLVHFLAAIKECYDWFYWNDCLLSFGNKFIDKSKEVGGKSSLDKENKGMRGSNFVSKSYQKYVIGESRMSR